MCNSQVVRWCSGYCDSLGSVCQDTHIEHLSLHTVVHIALENVPRLAERHPTETNRTSIWGHWKPPSYRLCRPWGLALMTSTWGAEIGVLRGWAHECVIGDKQFNTISDRISPGSFTAENRKQFPGTKWKMSAQYVVHWWHIKPLLSGGKIGPLEITQLINPNPCMVYVDGVTNKLFKFWSVRLV